ncbi:MAG: hypothetical protein ABW046_19365 [Actinoplanes sp.]
MVSQGRSLAVAAGWIVVPLGLGSLALAQSGGLALALAVAGMAALTPLALLSGAIWIARRGDTARSTAALGAQGGLIGLVVAGLAALAYVGLHWN